MGRELGPMLLCSALVPVAYSGILLHFAIANQECVPSTSRAQPGGASAGIFGLTWSKSILD